MASETTFDHWKVVFSWGKVRKRALTQNPLNGGFWSLGIQFFIHFGARKSKKITMDYFFLLMSRTKVYRKSHLTHSLTFTSFFGNSVESVECNIDIWDFVLQPYIIYHKKMSFIAWARLLRTGKTVVMHFFSNYSWFHEIFLELDKSFCKV